MKKALFTGSGVALVTPVKDKKVDYEKLGELLDFHVKNSTDAIILCGTLIYELIGPAVSKACLKKAGDIKAEQ